MCFFCRDFGSKDFQVVKHPGDSRNMKGYWLRIWNKNVACGIELILYSAKKRSTMIYDCTRTIAKKCQGKSRSVSERVFNNKTAIVSEKRCRFFVTVAPRNIWTHCWNNRTTFTNLECDCDVTVSTLATWRYLHSRRLFRVSARETVWMSACMHANVSIEEATWKRVSSAHEGRGVVFPLPRWGANTFDVASNLPPIFDPGIPISSITPLSLSLLSLILSPVSSMITNPPPK